MPRRQYSMENLGDLAYKAANLLAGRYAAWHVDRDDIVQEIWCWVYGDGKTNVERWLARNPQQTTRIFRSMMKAGSAFCETEKAEHVGYHVDDVWWYNEANVSGLMPLVADPTFTEANGKIGELITMVLDVRAVMTLMDRIFFESYYGDPMFEELPEAQEELLWAEHTMRVRGIVQRLGGSRPFRKAMSNAQALAITGESYE